MLFGSSIMIIVILISVVAFINKKNEIPANQLEVVLCDIGLSELHLFYGVFCSEFLITSRPGRGNKNTPSV